MLDRWRLDETWVGEQRSCWDPTGSSASTKLSPDPGRLAPSIAGGTAGTAHVAYYLAGDTVWHGLPVWVRAAAGRSVSVANGRTGRPSGN